jgi:hypothetical protein
MRRDAASIEFSISVSSMSVRKSERRFHFVQGAVPIDDAHDASAFLAFRWLLPSSSLNFWLDAGCLYFCT